MSETETPQDEEQIFNKISRLAEFYLSSDLDTISKDKIDEDRKYLEKLSQDRVRDRNLKRIQGLAKQIIPHFYIARGLATKSIPRKYEYYQHMEQARGYWGQIKGVVRARKSSSQSMIGEN